MRRLAGYALAVAVAGLAVAYVARPSPHIPPYDANLVRLAESALEGYCAGDVMWATQGAGDADLAGECRSSRASEWSSEPDMAAVEPAFCQAIVDHGWPGTTGDPMNDCLGILREHRLWPTFDGALTDQWNRARRYPGSAIGGLGAEEDDGSRTGGRTDTPRHEPHVRVPGSGQEPQEEEEPEEEEPTTQEEEEQ